nr:MAG TPA: putative head tail adaptor [Caudoviricetes sp.]DAT50972.1 MAG TPA: Putative head tail adaptor [Caudoviricetes sp.]
MNAGAFTHRLLFYRSEKTQSPSGAITEQRIESFSARAFLKTQRATFDRDGLQAREVVDPSLVIFVVREDQRLRSARWIRWRGDLYDIVLQTPSPDRTVVVTARYVDE